MCVIQLLIKINYILHWRFGEIFLQNKQTNELQSAFDVIIWLWNPCAIHNINSLSLPSHQEIKDTVWDIFSSVNFFEMKGNLAKLPLTLMGLYRWFSLCLRKGCYVQKAAWKLFPNTIWAGSEIQIPSINSYVYKVGDKLWHLWVNPSSCPSFLLPWTHLLKWTFVALPVCF